MAALRSRGKRMALGYRPGGSASKDSSGPPSSKVPKKSAPSTSSSAFASAKEVNEPEPDTQAPPAHISEMLQELHQLMKQAKDARGASEDRYIGINRVHDKIRQEGKVTHYYKSRLHILYTDALAEAKSEAALATQALDKITAIKKEISEKKSRSIAQASLNIEDMQPRKAGGMRKSVLMNILHQEAQDIPVWAGKPSELPPPLCGCIPADEKYKAKPGSQVAAHVRTEDGEEQWILAVVVSYNSHHHRYTVDDIDEDGRESGRHQVNRRKVIPLPMYKADPGTHSEALFKKDQVVLALYPQTTCFYKAVVHDRPKDVDAKYSVQFEDNTYAEGYAPPLPVPQRFVIPSKETRKART